ncbi:WRKY transcription factor WRKY71-like [Phragmites australis]|uniref:WRKY transcription factor WRKY71-like n=1 Tax=Phragmites australis TaxID=29695 RepID=UPI002D7943BB|nr:WRKY transcription factor WRKY71-like [Phragmites australis]XP_062219566.1 WRKY transcription factor WRKY71-like [Phragmites australis]
MRMAVVGARATPAAAPASHCHPHDDVFPTMAYRLPCNGGSASTYYGASPATPFPPAAAFGAAPGQVQLDVFECLSDESLPAAVPGTFGAPPPMPVVPDAAGCSHARGAAAVGARRPDRIAFRTRSEDEVLDDGYKWRKYGKKSVKNSPNPRNYYRCSTEGCNVKKRVERERDDPSYVLTMYEGVHNHVSPGTIYYATQDAASGRFFLAGMHHSGY